MTKKWIIGIIVLLAIGSFLFYMIFGRNTGTPESDYTPSKISTNTTLAENSEQNNSNEENKTTSGETNNQNTISNENEGQKTETKISSFSTPIVDNHKNRLNNIKITCSRINNTIVNANEEFSFCKIVGQPTAKDGYKEAHAFVDGKLTNAIGGGNCQVSTTIYNAVKKIDGVKITERHEHDKPIGYIEMGKDATVAYDYLDLKFKNNNDYALKLKAYMKNNKVWVDVYKVV